MKPLNVLFNGVALLTTASALGGCAGSSPQWPIGAQGAMPQTTAAVHHADRGRSWMLPTAKSMKRLLYLANSGPDVYIYDYDNFNEVGTLTGLNNPEQECVDAKGNIWIAEDVDGAEGGGDAVEYAHGGTTMLNEVTTNQPPGGCSVSPNGDLEITDGGILSGSGVLGPGEVQIWKSASGSPVDYGPISNCYYLNSGGYDNKGNLYVTGLAQDQDSIGICELPIGGSSLIPVTVERPITDPVGIMWDGKYMAITDDSNANSDYTTTIYQTEERRKGRALSIAGRTTLADSCFGNEVYILPSPFIVGKKNTPVNTTQGTGVIGFNFICGVNPSKFRAWAYPAGGSPLRAIEIPSGGGEAVSIAP